MKIILILFSLVSWFQLTSQFYSTVEGKVHFISNAPLEVIEANSNKLQGLIDVENKSFAFKIYIKSFQGFNSALQKVHFYENYMEVKEYPIAIFKGKILEPLKNGTGKYRAKGILNIHGQSVERIIDLELDVSLDSIIFNTEFLVPLEDHDIDLPRIVYQKIAEEIMVTVNGSLLLKE